MSIPMKTIKIIIKIIKVNNARQLQRKNNNANYIQET